jgi:hypothetical protein
MERAGTYIASPGAVTEHTTVFIAEVDTAKAGGVHGLAAETEDIKSHVVRPRHRLRLVERGDRRRQRGRGAALAPGCTVRTAPPLACGSRAERLAQEHIDSSRRGRQPCSRPGIYQPAKTAVQSGRR